jgi:hypothetical protein
MINRKSAIQSIDVRGLPEPFVTTLQSMAQMFRSTAAEIDRAGRRTPRDGAPRKAGKLKGGITRADLYGDVG